MCSFGHTSFCFLFLNSCCCAHRPSLHSPAQAQGVVCCQPPLSIESCQCQPHVIQTPLKDAVSMFHAVLGGDQQVLAGADSAACSAELAGCMCIKQQDSDSVVISERERKKAFLMLYIKLLFYIFIFYLKIISCIFFDFCCHCCCRCGCCCPDVNIPDMSIIAIIQNEPLKPHSPPPCVWHFYFYFNYFGITKIFINNLS